MSDPQHKHDQLVILNVIDNSVIADTDTELAVTATQLQTPRRTRVLCERLDRGLQARNSLRMKPPKSLRGSPRDGDPVRHVSPGSKPKLFHQVFKRNARFLASFRCRKDVRLVLQRLQRTVVEFRRYDYRTATHSARSDLDRLSLSCSDVVALLAAELR